MRVLTSIQDYFLPRFCFSCDVKLQPFETLLCKHCKGKIVFASRERLTFEYQKKFSSENLISDFISLFLFEKDKPFQHLVHQLKYRNKFGIGNYLGGQIAGMFSDTIKIWNADYIVPVPLHRLKKAERGYNQSF